VYGDRHSELRNGDGLGNQIIILRLIPDIPNLRFFRFRGGRIDRWKLLSEEEFLERITPVRVDRLPPEQQGKPIDELIELFSLDDPPSFNLGSPSLFVFDPDETTAEFVIRIRTFLRIDARHARFYLVGDNSVERLIEGDVKIADLIKSVGM
jgi:hypothetical protein